MQLIINFKAAKALGITIPLPVSGRADEVIEWSHFAAREMVAIG